MAITLSHTVIKAMTRTRNYSRSSILATVLSGLVFSFTTIPLANAAVLELTDEPYDYITVDQSLPSVLRAFGANLGFSVQVSKDVRGQVRGKLPELSQRQFLEFLSRTYGLVWYFDGFVLHVETARESESKVFKLTSITPDRLEKSLKDLNIWDQRFAIKNSPGSDLTYVSGPKRYVDLVEDTIRSLQGRDRAFGSVGGSGPGSTMSPSGVEIIYGTK